MKNLSIAGKILQKGHPSVPSVMLGEMRSGDFWVSAKAARGMVQFRAGPQKWVDIKYSLNSFDLKYVATFCMVRPGR